MCLKAQLLKIATINVFNKLIY